MSQSTRIPLSHWTRVSRESYETRSSPGNSLRGTYYAIDQSIKNFSNGTKTMEVSRFLFSLWSITKHLGIHHALCSNKGLSLDMGFRRFTWRKIIHTYSTGSHPKVAMVSIPQQNLYSLQGSQIKSIYHFRALMKSFKMHEAIYYTVSLL